MIKVDNISKTYELDNKDKVIGIKNISFEVKEGEILGMQLFMLVILNFIIINLKKKQLFIFKGHSVYGRKQFVKMF